MASRKPAWIFLVNSAERDWQKKDDSGNLVLRCDYGSEI